MVVVVVVTVVVVMVVLLSSTVVVAVTFFTVVLAAPSGPKTSSTPCPGTTKFSVPAVAGSGRALAAGGAWSGSGLV